MKSHASVLAMLAIAAGTLLGAASGCELIAAVDRNKIQTGGAGGEGGTTTAGGGGTGGTTASTTTEGGGGTGGTTTTSTPTGCTSPDDCEQPTEDCKVATCDTATGMCGVGNAPDGTDAQDQLAGDCFKNVCSGGVVVPEVDTSDIEDDAKDCTMDTCAADGTVLHDPITMGACDDMGGAVCDDEGTGNCVECNTDVHCQGNVNGEKCADSHVCVPASCADMTLNGAETDVDCGGAVCGKCADTLNCEVPGDCQSNNCDVNGKCEAGTCDDLILNNMQLGETDVDCGGDTCPKCVFDKGCSINADCIGGVCTGNKCAATCTDTAKNQDESDVDCGGVCDDCENGDICNSAADCQSNFCNDSNICDTCEDDGQCAGAEYCDNGVCVPDLPTGSLCVAGTQCVTGNCVDGVCCGDAMCATCQSCALSGSEGSCTNIPSGQTDNVPANTCVGASVCDGMGNCDKINGEVCAAGGECLSGNCVDGVCCDTACTATCRSCAVSGSVGTCTNLTGGVDDTFPANACVGTNSCAAGVCKKDNGQTCAAGTECVSGNCVDGRCCGSASCATCQSCAVSGSEGTCTNIPNGQPDNVPANTCVGTSVCDGTGNCEKINGQVCGAGTECLSGNCIDGVCCNTACGALCFACNVPGSLGTCSPNQAGTEESNECPSAPSPSCNGEGACGNGGAQGVPCVSGGCQGGLTCVDGVCCDTACTGLCVACVASKTGGTNGTCAAITAGTDPDNECSGGTPNCGTMANMCGP